MSKAVLISIRPKWCELIASGHKAIEVRKTRPQIKTPFKCYIYCTNSGRPLVYGDKPCADGWTEAYTQTYGYSREEADKIWGVMNGKVIGEFVCDEIKHYVTLHAPDFTPYYMKEEKSDEVSFIDFDETCLTEEDFFEYGSGNDLYGWHISSLIIYDVPKKLSEFMKKPCDFAASCGACGHAKWLSGHRFDGCELQVTRPPQSWCYVEELS